MTASYSGQLLTQLPHSGDQQLRGGYSRVLLQLLGELGVRQVRDVVDLGCATGLSSLELLRALPGSRVTGVDLSPHFLAVGQHQHQQRTVRWQRVQLIVTTLMRRRLVQWSR